MSNTSVDNHYEVIIVGSGTSGATLARELCKKKKKVLILERGGYEPLKETLGGMFSIFDEQPVAKNLKEARAITTGGSTALYFGVAELPPVKAFQSLGIDISNELEEARKELPLAELSDDLIGDQSVKLKESAVKLGYDWKKKLMLVDQSKCTSGYSYDAKWKARNFVDEATGNGATLINKALVQKVIFDNKKAIGVEYKKQKKVFKVYGDKIILAAGPLVTPVILRNSGVKNVEDNGYYIDPSVGLIGTVPGLQGKENFCGCMGAKMDDEISLIDANFSRFLFNMGMISIFRPFRIAAYPRQMAILAKTHDKVGGKLLENGKFHKDLDESDLKRVKRGEEAIRKILKNAGAKDIISTGIITGGVFGTLKIKKQVDEKFQTEHENLFVCDGSILLENERVTPTLTLVCLAKRLAKQLAASL
jgi:hypothetical protein